MIVTASVLNVRSGPGTQFAAIAQRRQNETVDVQEVVGDWSRIAPCGWVASMFLSAPLALAVPKGLAGVRATFGEACSPACSAGRVQLPAPIRLYTSNASVTRIACHVLLEQVFHNVFSTIFARNLWGLIQSYDGIYNCRRIGTGQKWSTHAWGIGIDINASTNRQGTTGDMDRRLINIFEEEGFFWGGRWSGKARDPMHFQYAEGY